MVILIEDILAFISSATFSDLIAIGKALLTAIESKGTSAAADIAVVESATDAAEDAKVGKP